MASGSLALLLAMLALAGCVSGGNCSGLTQVATNGDTFKVLPGNVASCTLPVAQGGRCRLACGLAAYVCPDQDCDFECKPDSLWEPSQLFCELGHCGPLPVGNGYTWSNVLCSTADSAVFTYCFVACTAGYSPYGSQSAVQCRRNSAMDGTFWFPSPANYFSAVCAATVGYCSVSLLPLTNAVAKVAGGSFPCEGTFQVNCDAACNVGYFSPAPSPVWECSQMGSPATPNWVGAPPSPPVPSPWSCSKIALYCPLPNVGSWASPGPCVRSIDGNCSYTCNNGYIAPAPGQTWRLCSAGNVTHGTWSSSWPANATSWCQAKPLYCPSVSVWANGVLGACSRQITGTCTYSCNNGYTRGAVSASTCTAGTASVGVWSPSWDGTCALTPNYCPAVAAGTNGVLGACSRFLAGTCTYSCNNGYTRVAPTARTCTVGNATVGVWSPSWNGTCALTPNYCVRPALASGLTFGANCASSSTLGGSCSYSCGLGYAANDTLVRSCLIGNTTHGTWSTAWPALLCVPVPCVSTLAPPGNGTWSGDPNPIAGVTGDERVADCNEGFMPLSDSARDAKCNESSLWSPPVMTACVPKPCVAYVAPANASVSSASGTTGDLRVVSCAFGYRPQPAVVELSNGSRLGQIQCTPSGTWTAAGSWPVLDDVTSNTITCVPNPCPALAPVGNGTFTPDSTGVTADVRTLVCAQGFATSIAMATTTCRPLNGSHSVWIQDFSPLQPMWCVPLPCSPLPAPANGFVPMPIATTFQFVETRCNEGFQLRNVGYSPAQMSCSAVTHECVLYRQCLATGNWSLALPTCDALPCPTLPRLGNATEWTPANATGRVTRDEVVTTCLDGFRMLNSTGLVNDGTATCVPFNRTTSMWAPFRFYCGERACYPSNRRPVNGTCSAIDGEFGTVAHFGCNAGFALVGASTRLCNASGNWTEAQPHCRALPCPNLLVRGEITYTNVTGVTDTVRTATCSNGYFFIDETVMPQSGTRTCVPATPTLSAWMPADMGANDCKPRPCPVLTAPADGSYDTRIGVTGGNSTLHCTLGYAPRRGAGQAVAFGLEPSFGLKVACKAAGPNVASAWDPAAPTCELFETYCPAPVAPTNGSLVAAQQPCGRTLGSSACFTRYCLRGFRLEGAPTPTCVVGSATVGVWADEGACVACVPGTYAVEDSGPTAVVPTGSWRCDPCPLGARCAGVTAVPVADDGWWQNPSTGGFLECAPVASCPNGQCRRGHTGFRCADCSVGFFKRNGEFCVACPPAKETVYPIMIALAVLLCILLVVLARRSSRYFAPLAVGFSFLQLISILPAYKLAWPPATKELFELFAVFNLDTSQFFEPQCLVGRESKPFVTTWAVKMSLPLIFTGIFFVGALALVGYARLTRAADRLLPRWVPRVSATGLKVLLWSCVNALLTCTVLVYIVVVSGAMSTFGCNKQRDGSTTMRAEPSILCTSVLWRQMVGGSVVVVVVFGLGFPSLLTTLLRTRRYNLWKEKNVIRFGLLYTRYSREMYVWEIVLLGRKFAFVFGQAMFPFSPLAQIIWGFVVLALGLAAHVRWAPFRDVLVNRLESFHLGCALVVLGFGVLFELTTASLSSSSRSSLAWVMIAVILINVLVIVAVIVYVIRAQIRLGRHGVSGSIASDEINVSPAFFALGARFVSKKRMRSAHALVFAFEFRVQTAAAMHVELVQREIGQGASVAEVLHDVAGAQPNWVRLVRAPSADLVYVWALLPCRGVYALRVLLDETPPELGGKARLSAEREPALIQFTTGTDSGCDEAQRLVATPELTAAGGAVLAPVERVLEAGRERVFRLVCPGVSAVALVAASSVDAPPVDPSAAESATTAVVPFFLEHEPLVSQVATHTPLEGALQLWARLPSGLAAPSRGVRTLAPWQLIAVYQVLPAAAGALAAEPTLTEVLEAEAAHASKPSADVSMQRV